jgi:TolB-like protein/DNA-binding winged helix-turn-helix (wHTH) protein
MTEENRRPGPVSPIDLVGEADFPLGASRVSPSRLEVSRAGLHETLEPRIMQVLVALYQADGRVVSRDELIARCWEGRVVGEDAITRAIGRLRRLSGADDGASFAIETIPKIGFRLVTAGQTTAAGAGPPVLSPVASLPAESMEKTVPGLDIAPVVGLPRRRGWRLVVGLSLPAVAAFALAAWLLWPARPAGISVAVLPFVNMSGEANQEFFSDGITEEITAALAKVPGLTVIGRTSAFQFKGENKDMRAIGQALGVSNLIEGSVRKAGNQVRITAQLIKSADGTHLWTESYDRKLTDIFAVQEDIATAIAGALQVPLGLKPGQSLISNRTADTDSYQDYLRAKELYRARGFTNFTQAITLLENVIARDPNYAPAWALLANVYVLMPAYPLVSATFDEAQHLRDVYFPKAEAAARKAVSLDANNADALGALGASLAGRYKFIQAEDTYRQGLRLDPNNLIILNYLAHGLSGSGRLKESLAIWQKLNKLDPLDRRLKLNLARILALDGQYDAAVAIYMKLGNADVDLATVYAAQGRFQEAADQLLRVPTGTFPVGMVESASRLLRSAPVQVPSPEDLPALTPPLQFVYLYVGGSSRAIHIGEPYWYPAGATLRNSQNGKAYEREHGFLDYWRARGWPDLCHPVGADDYACK